MVIGKIWFLLAEWSIAHKTGAISITVDKRHFNAVKRGASNQTAEGSETHIGTRPSLLFSSSLTVTVMNEKPWEGNLLQTHTNSTDNVCLRE